MLRMVTGQTFAAFAFVVTALGAPTRAAMPSPQERAKGPIQQSAKESSQDQVKHDKGPRGREAEPPAAPKTNIVIVVSRENPTESLTVEELRRIFLRETMHWKHGPPIAVFERPTESPICGKFSKTVLKKTAAELKDHWMRLQITRGLKPPKVLRTAALVKEYLQRVQGGISYLDERDLDDSVKRIHITDFPAERG